MESDCGFRLHATQVSTYNLWVALHSTGERPHRRRPRARPGAMLDRQTALRLCTRVGVELTGEEEVKGVLRPGCYADLAVPADIKIRFVLLSPPPPALHARPRTGVTALLDHIPCVPGQEPAAVGPYGHSRPCPPRTRSGQA
ncbi:amidohydrolase family protein [Streptomyces atratus]